MRRLAFVLLTSAALTGASGLVLPAYGQSAGAGVGNNGEASAGTGGNSSVGNTSGNTAASDAAQTQPADGGLLGLGGLLSVSLNLGNSGSNTSNGTSAVSTGPATASGNTTDSGVAQSGSGGVSPIFGPAVPAQSAGVGNSGSAAADTGGNRSVGNGSTNTAASSQTVSAGLLAVGVNLANVQNVSNGTSTINTGAAAAAGNEAVTTVDQQAFGPGLVFGPGVCDGFHFLRGQHADVENAGSARADTGGNASVGNQSTNEASSVQVVEGGLIALPINLGLLGGVSNVSDGQSAITTGAATASGNRATTAVTQQCLEPVALGSPIFGPPIGPHKQFFETGHAPKFELARTGVDPFVMGLVAFSLLFGGFLFLVWERVEALPEGHTGAARAAAGS
jgi:hypothetical protein